MIPRYRHKDIAALFTDQQKLLGWQEVELAVPAARVRLGLMNEDDYNAMRASLLAVIPDVEWWLKRDSEIHHDLNAFLDERRRFIPVELQHHFHKDMTSYDTEEAASTLLLMKASGIVMAELRKLMAILAALSEKHRYTPMLDRTHGQWAKLKSFGARVLNWIAELNIAQQRLEAAVAMCRFSRLSGAVGNYGGSLTPRIEEEALKILGLVPFYGATQIMPRSVAQVPLAQSLGNLCGVLNKIALDIRLGARSGYTLYREPFGKKQKGSSAMPHKKNTILTEQMEGMARLARAFESSIAASISTWESRAIDQSCVERIAWPDLFHVTARMATVMTKVLGGLVVYPGNMMREIVMSGGTYASDEAKNFLAEECAKRGVDAEIAYRIVQLASFCVFRQQPFWERLDKVPPHAGGMDEALATASSTQIDLPKSIQSLIGNARLWSMLDEVEASLDEVIGWNALLREIFDDEATVAAWNNLFKPSHLLAQEDILFQKIIRVG